MSTVTTLRPSSTSSGVGWTASAGTRHGATSDNSDATYVTWGGAGSPMILATPVDSPPAGERRHQVRLRARGEDGSAWWAVRLSSGALVAGASAQFTASPGTITGSWGFGAPADGSTVLYAYVTGQTIGVRIQELYLDVDSREAPTFTPQILDGSGTSTTTISDTAQPVLRASAVDLDDLNAKQYRYWVTLGGVVVWDTGVVSGASSNRQTTALANGAYVAHFQVWSTLGANTAYASDEETLAFTVSVGTIDPPPDAVADPVADTPFVTVEVCAPADVYDLDDGVGWVEVQRVDCPVGGYLSLPGTTAAYASTPNPGPALTDLQVTVVAGRDDGWWPSSEETLAAHYDTASNHRSWRLTIGADTGLPLLSWSPTGTSSLVFAESTERAPIDPFGVVRLRVLLDTNDGAGGWTVIYLTRETDDDDWVQLGDVLTNSGAGTTSMFNASTVTYTVGTWFAAGVPNVMFTGRIYSVEVRNGAAGAVLMSPDFTGRLAGTASFMDDQGNVWTVSPPAWIYSPTSFTTTAMVGPLESEECASWVDWSLPRTGVSASCDHDPIECCSYYRVRTVGREGGDLRISEWAEDTADTFCLVWDEDAHLIRTEGPDGPMWVNVWGKFEWTVERPFTASTGVNGTRFVTSAAPGGRNLSMTAAVESEADLASLRAVLARPLVLISPSDAAEVWAAPVAESVRIVKVGRIRQVTASFIGTGPQPPPQLADVGA